MNKIDFGQKKIPVTTEKGTLGEFTIETREGVENMMMNGTSTSSTGRTRRDDKYSISKRGDTGWKGLLFSEGQNLESHSMRGGRTLVDV